MNPEKILKKYWGYEAFRPLQSEIIDSILSGKDTLAILPTGGGKSVCFQVPALLNEGVCIVVSPLIALMKDQVFQLTQRGISAAAVFSMQDKSTNIAIVNDVIDGKIKFLYVSPERINNDQFLESIRYAKVNLLAIDEAHCISKWGYDFRPSYLDIYKLKEAFHNPSFPTVALTATATKKVRVDIVEKLKLTKVKTFVKSFARENLAYMVKEVGLKEQDLISFLNSYPGSSIVYAKTRKRTQEIAVLLRKKGLEADFYHAGLGIYERNKKQDKWITSQSGIMVATNAFGMGIDKANVRTVVHMDLCDNLEAYYQESGRAGRDGEPCKALLLYNDADIEILERNLEQKYPEKEVLKKVYQSLANYYQVEEGEYGFKTEDFNLFEFASTFGLSVLESHHALKILESQNLIYLSESYFQSSKVKILLNAPDLDHFLSRNPAYQEFAQTFLRVYGGELFSSYMQISEKEIASVYRNSYSKTVEALNFLHKQRAIDYIPQKSTPQFSFIDYRYDAQSLPINYRELNERKSNDRRALKAMVNFAEQEHRCRMAYIQDYFDEPNPAPCGKCDVCKSKQYLGIDGEAAFDLKNRILQLLPISFIRLEESIIPTEKDLAQKIIKEGLETGEFKMDSFGLIFVSE